MDFGDYYRDEVPFSSQHTRGHMIATLLIMSNNNLDHLVKVVLANFFNVKFHTQFFGSKSLNQTHIQGSRLKLLEEEVKIESVNIYKNHHSNQQILWRRYFESIQITCLSLQFYPLILACISGLCLQY